LSLRKAIEAFLADPPLQQGYPGYPCKVNRILADLAKEDAQALEELVDKQDIAAAAVARLLNEHGFDIKSASIIKHRKRGQHNGCRCVKTK